MFHDWVILDREMMYEKMKIHILPVKNSSFIHFPDGSKGRKQQIIIPNTRNASIPALVFLNRDDEKHSSTITDVFSHSFHWQYCAMWLNDDWIDPYYFFDYFHIINIFFLFDVQCAVRQQWFLVIYSFFYGWCYRFANPYPLCTMHHVHRIRIGMRQKINTIHSNWMNAGWIAFHRAYDMHNICLIIWCLLIDEYNEICRKTHSTRLFSIFSIESKSKGWKVIFSISRN